MLRWSCIALLLSLGLLSVQQKTRALELSDFPAYTFDGTMRRVHVPILMYHYVSPLPPDADVYRIDLTVEPDVFYAHMAYLDAEGYTTISLYDLHNALTLGTPLPERPIILTFDDGHIDHYQYVYPILRDFGFFATFFVITGKADVGDPAHLNWSQIREMSDAGMDMESHTKSHQDLRERSHDFLVYEVVGSIESLKAHTGQPIHMFCYPSGRYDEATLELLQRLNVWRAVTTQPGAYHTTDNRLELPRLRISGNLNIMGLAHLLDNNHA